MKWVRIGNYIEEPPFISSLFLPTTKIRGSREDFGHRVK